MWRNANQQRNFFLNLGCFCSCPSSRSFCTNGQWRWWRRRCDSKWKSPTLRPWPTLSTWKVSSTNWRPSPCCCWTAQILFCHSSPNWSSFITRPQTTWAWLLRFIGRISSKSCLRSCQHSNLSWAKSAMQLFRHWSAWPGVKMELKKHA